MTIALFPWVDYVGCKNLKIIQHLQEKYTDIGYSISCRRFSSSVGNTITSARNNNASAPPNVAGSGRIPQRPRGRIVRAVSRGRGSGVIVGSRPLLPASVVPEELVNQVTLFSILFV